MIPDEKKRGSFLPFCRPTIGEEEIAEVVESLRSGWITTGPKVSKFEEIFKNRLGVRNAIAVNSATSGLHLAAAALNLKPEDEVIVPALTWAATANVVELCGARTVFADVDPDTLCIDPDDAARRITRRTRAIIPVHYAGQPADLDRFIEITERKGLAFIEDAAHALGTSYKGREIGSSGNVVVFSFHPIKNITTGEGGMIMCNDDALADRFRLLRFHGVSKDAWKRYHRGGVPEYDIVEPGWKFNMLDIQAAIGLHQMNKLADFNARRAKLAALYTKLLADAPEIVPLGLTRYPSVHAWHLFIVRLDLKAVKTDRNEFMLALQEENIGTGLHFPTLHMSSYYRGKYGYKSGDLPNAEKAGNSIFSLPLYPLMSEGDAEDVVRAIKAVIAKNRRS
ncbi:MAG TPA: aminotransferase class I/II-fold pyridoxal phosphate-dependent enzyme [Candidatus Brocadiia bacterium]|nr:aminotransferase class I/II-fold pyridoxal phosphate-dependent enzyme [Candidatus Brocadiia bacterium]